MHVHLIMHFKSHIDFTFGITIMDVMDILNIIMVLKLHDELTRVLCLVFLSVF